MTDALSLVMTFCAGISSTVSCTLILRPMRVDERVDQPQARRQRDAVTPEPLDRPLVALRHRAHAARDHRQDDDQNHEQEQIRNRRSFMSVPLLRFVSVAAYALRRIASDAVPIRPRDCKLGGGEVFERGADRFEKRDLLRIAPTRGRAASKRIQIAGDALSGQHARGERLRRGRPPRAAPRRCRCKPWRAAPLRRRPRASPAESRRRGRDACRAAATRRGSAARARASRR